MSRETAYRGLFALLEALQANGHVETCGRKAKHIDDHTDAELPALYLNVHDNDIERRERLPAKRTLGALIYLYVGNKDPDEPAGVVLNGLLDALDAALAPSPVTEVQTLGGAVSHCWIEGKVEIFEGLLSQRAAAIVPIHMLVP